MYCTTGNLQTFRHELYTDYRTTASILEQGHRLMKSAQYSKAQVLRPVTKFSIQTRFTTLVFRYETRNLLGEKILELTQFRTVAGISVVSQCVTFSMLMRLSAIGRM